MAHLTEHGDWRWIDGRRRRRRARGAGRRGRSRCATGRPTWASSPTAGADPVARRRPAARARIGVLRAVDRDRVFLALAGSFFICGATTVGLIAVHLIPAAHDHGIPAGPRGGADGGHGRARHRRHDRLGLADRPLRRAQAAARLLRGPRHLAADPARRAEPARARCSLAFTVFYGLDWIATVPPTVALATQRFGRDVGLVAFGWIFGAHQIGAAAAAWAAGMVRDGAGHLRRRVPRLRPAVLRRRRDAGRRPRPAARGARAGPGVASGR